MINENDGPTAVVVKTLVVVVNSPCYSVESKTDGRANTRNCKGSSTVQLFTGLE